MFPNDLPERDTFIETAFPNLVTEGYRITSPVDPRYNCIAWAASDNARFWWPDSFGVGYWPPNVRRECTLQAFIDAYSTVGFSVCENLNYEEGKEKIAIYLDRNGIPTHAARLLSENIWTSKLGPQYDISHGNRGVSDTSYGTPHTFMERILDITQG